MDGSHHRKVELQSTADLAYLYANTVALSRQKLDLHFPPSANESDPMKQRVSELVDEFITTTYTTAIPSISINGLDTSSTAPTPSSLQSLLSTRESVEYEPYDAALAARVSALHAQLESLTTTVAQMRRDAPMRAAKTYKEALDKAIAEDDEEGNEEEEEEEEEEEVEEWGDDVEVKMDDGGDNKKQDTSLSARRDLRRALRRHPEWKLQMPLGTEQEQERWRDGEMGEVYADAVKTLAHLQGEIAAAGSADSDADEGDDSGDADASVGIATTVGKVERAGKAAEVVERM